MTINRRSFVSTAGTSAMLAMLPLLDPVANAETVGAATLPSLPAGNPGNQHRVVIIGAGISGLVAAYELKKRGFNCTVLEGEDRSGGRNFTIRRGTRVSETGKADQLCKFDDGLYMNAGPARLASSHRLMLDYCRQFNIALELFVNFNTNALFISPHHFEGMSVRLRRLELDLMQHLGDLVRDAVKSGALGNQLSDSDADLLLQQFQRFTKAQSGRAMGTPGSPGVTGQPALIALQQLLRSRFWKATSYQQLDQFQQPTLLQPVGGMDKIVTGFETALASEIKKQCTVRQIENRKDGVVVSWWDATSNRQESMKADYCIASIPAPLFAGIKTNFSAAYREALRSVRFSKGAKLGWQAMSRPWEEQQSIYGGISFVDHPIRQFWYPSGGFQAASAVVVGAYPLNRAAERFANLSYSARAQLSLEGAERLHPGIGKLLRHPVSIAWQRQRLAAGVWPRWKHGFSDPAFAKLLKAEGRTFLAGDQISELPGWQEGAAMSAHRIAGEIIQASSRD